MGPYSYLFPFCFSMGYLIHFFKSIFSLTGFQKYLSIFRDFSPPTFLLLEILIVCLAKAWAPEL